MTQCNHCANLTEIWEDCEFRGYDCGLDIKWTAELYEAVERGDCPYYELEEASP